MDQIKKEQFSLIFIIFPFLLITGPFLPDLFIILLDIFILFILSKRIKNIFYKSHYLYFFFIFYFYINLNSIIAYDSFYSFQTSLPYFRFIFFSFILSYLLINIKNLRKIIIFSFLFTYSVLLIDSCIQLFFGKNILGYALQGSRVSSFLGEWLVMGSFVSRTMPVVLGLTFFEKIKYKNALQISILFITGILVVLSAERLAFMYFLITLFFFIFFKINKKNLFFIIFLTIIIFLSIFYIRPAAYERLFNHTFMQLKEADNPIFSSYRHQLHYITAINQFKDSMLFGHGLKSFRLLCDNSKYVPINKIIDDNKLATPVDGYVFFLLDEENNNYVVIKNTNISATTIYDHDIIFKKKYSGHLLKKYVSNGQLVKKNQSLLSSYEYINGCNTHPHNVHLQFLAEIGLIGYILLIVAFLFIIYRLFLIIRKRTLNKFVNDKEYYIFFSLLGLFLTLFPLFPSGNFFNNWLSSIFYFNVANLISILPLKKK